MRWPLSSRACATVLVALWLFAGALAHAADAAWPGAQWQKVEPAAGGWSAAGLAQADGVARSLRTDAYLVVHHGRIVHEYGATATPTNIHSARKSVLSVLYGIHFDRGEIDLDQNLAALGIDDRDQLTDTEKQATVRQLLQARSGIYHRSAYETREMTASHPPRGTAAPGRRFEYNNWDFNALGTIFQRLTNESVFDALERELAAPLQFEDFTRTLHTRWVYERFVSEHPAYEMKLSARDLARVGLLMARGGLWKDRRIVSESWVRESTTSYSDTGPGIGYGYLWWVGQGYHFGSRFPGPVFSARGNFGQFVVVDPARDLVIVHKVSSDGLFHSNVTVRGFGPLLAKILAAGPDLVQPQ